MRTILLSFSLFLSVLFSFQAKSQVPVQSGIKFNHISLDDVLKQADQTNKLVFIYFYFLESDACKLINDEVFSQKKVDEFYNTNFICLRIHIGLGEGPEICQKYRVKGCPTFLFLNAKGEIEHQGMGFVNASAFIELGKMALNRTSNYHGLSEKIRRGDNSFETVNSVFKLTLLTDIHARDSLLNFYFKNKPQEQWVDKNSLQLIVNYSLLNSIYGKFILNNEVKLKDKIGANQVESGIERMLMRFYNDDYRELGLSGMEAKLYLDSIGHPLINKVYFYRKLETCYLEVADKPFNSDKWIGLFDVCEKLMDRYGSKEKKVLFSCISNYVHKFEKRIPVILPIIKDIHHKMAPYFISNINFAIYQNHLKSDSLISRLDLFCLNTNYKEFLGDTLVDKSTINNLAWAMVKHPMRRELLVTAKELSAYTIINCQQGFIFDTYATICAQLGQFDEAVKNQEIAVKLVSELAPEDKERYIESLEKFKNKTALF